MIVVDISPAIEAGRATVERARRRLEVAIRRLAVARRDLVAVDPRAAADLELALVRDLLGIRDGAST